MSAKLYLLRDVSRHHYKYACSENQTFISLQRSLTTAIIYNHVSVFCEISKMLFRTELLETDSTSLKNKDAFATVVYFLWYLLCCIYFLLKNSIEQR